MLILVLVFTGTKRLRQTIRSHLVLRTAEPVNFSFLYSVHAHAHRSNEGGANSDNFKREVIIVKSGNEQRDALSDHGTVGQERPNMMIVDFEKQEGVVIAVCIYGDRHDIALLKQSLCLLKAAYPVHYDHLVFTTLPLPEKDVQELEQIVAPARIQITNSTRPLLEELADLTSAQQADLCERCNVSSINQIHWNTNCEEKGRTKEFGACTMRYRWQAEFRAKYLWSHPALDPYRYLIWMDSDAMCTQPWNQDPIAIMMRNNLVFFFLNRVGGIGGKEFRARTRRAFQGALCSVELVDGHLEPNFHIQNDYIGCNGNYVRKVHGFFHITDLELYKSPQALQWYESLVGDDKFSRHWDDQIAVTVPGAMLAPNRSWDMHSNGFRPQLLHNSYLDGKDELGYWYLEYWRTNATTNFPEAVGVCNRLIKKAGRRH